MEGDTMATSAEHIVRLVAAANAAELVRGAGKHLAEAHQALMVAHRRLDPESQHALGLDATLIEIEALHKGLVTLHRQMTEGV